MKTFSILFLLSTVIASQAFSVQPSLRVVRKVHQPEQTRICPHTFTTSTTITSLNLSPLDEDEKENVNVNLVNDVDSFTLTAVGFAAIAFNFLVFANMGDAGIGGIIARLINWLT